MLAHLAKGLRHSKNCLRHVGIPHTNGLIVTSTRRSLTSWVLTFRPSHLIFRCRRSRHNIAPLSRHSGTRLRHSCTQNQNFCHSRRQVSVTTYRRHANLCNSVILYFGVSRLTLVAAPSSILAYFHTNAWFTIISTKSGIVKLKFQSPIQSHDLEVLFRVDLSEFWISRGALKCASVADSLRFFWHIRAIVILKIDFFRLPTPHSSVSAIRSQMKTLFVFDLHQFWFLRGALSLVSVAYFLRFF